MTLQNRFIVLSEDADGIPVPSRLEKFAKNKCSDTEFCEFVGRPRRRLTMIRNPSGRASDVPCKGNEAIEPSGHPRNSSLRSQNAQGSSTWEAIPREFRRLRWSVFQCPVDVGRSCRRRRVCHSRGDLAEWWMHRQGFVRWEAHFSGPVQE